MPAGTASEGRALHVLAQVVSDSPFRARELIERVCAGTREAFGFKRVEWRPPVGLVPVPGEGQPPPDQADLSVLSALGEAAAAVAAKARDVDRADRRKTDFVSVASHELRTPISVVHGIAATLNARIDDLDQVQVQALLGTLVQQTDRLRDLADQLLDLSRIESGSPGLQPERFRPRDRLGELLPRIAGGREDDVLIDFDAGLELVTDPVAFERVAAHGPGSLDRLRLRGGARRAPGVRGRRPARGPLHPVATGSSKLKRDPSPSRDSTQIVPFIRRT